MRICFISAMGGSPWGGSETLWSETAHKALAGGHAVAILTYRWPVTPKRILELQSRGAKVFHRSGDRTRRAVRIVEQFVHPLPALVRWKPDVICFSQGEAYDTVYCQDLVRFQQRCGVPYVVVCQYNTDLDIPRPQIRRQAIDFFQHSYRIAFVAESNRQGVERQLAVPLPNACVLRNPVNFQNRTLMPWPELAAPRLANVARLQATCKGQDILLEVLSGAAWKSRLWSLDLYGEGPDRAYLQDLARHFGIAERVTFCGHVEDVRSIWATHPVLVLPSRSEGTPLALVEAMICGRPAVVTDVGGNLEWVRESLTGFVAEAPTVRSFGAALERAWQSREAWQEMGMRAHGHALSQYDPSPELTLLNLLFAATNHRS
jgi:glycosyltransferase involved in cell wall biosynthesis